MECNAILEQVNKVIVGKNDVCQKVLTAVLAGGHVLLEDVPGVGKTTLAMAFSKVLGLECRRVQFTSDTMPSDITGFGVYNRQKECFVYQPGPVMTNLFLADEINRTSSKTQAALLEVMEEKRVTVDGNTYPLPEPFIVLATQNPVGSAGTQRLPASQLDRFMVRLSMGYPDFKSQVDILRDRHTDDPLEKLSTVISRKKLTDMQKQASSVFVSEPVYEYITRLAESTRSHPDVELGLSPRGALSLCRFAKAYSFVQGRDFVSPRDVREVFGSVAAHRIELSAKAAIEGKKAEDIVAKIADSTEMPALRPAGRVRA